METANKATNTESDEIIMTEININSETVKSNNIFSTIDQVLLIDKKYNIIVKLISNLSDEEMVVGDQTGSIILRFNDELNETLAQYMKPGATYNIYNVEAKYMTPHLVHYGPPMTRKNNKKYLFMGSGSYVTLANKKNNKIMENVPMLNIKERNTLCTSNNCIYTSKDLFKIYVHSPGYEAPLPPTVDVVVNYAYEVKGHLMMKLIDIGKPGTVLGDSVATSKQPWSTTKHTQIQRRHGIKISENGLKYRKALFMDEYNTITLTAYGADCDEMDKWSIGSIYEINNFKAVSPNIPGPGELSLSVTSSKLLNSLSMEQVTPIEWGTNITNIQKIKTIKTDNIERCKKLLLLDNIIRGKIIGFYQKESYKICFKCYRSVNKFLDEYNLDEYKLKSTGYPSCRCGCPLKSKSTDAFYDERFSVIMLLEHEQLKNSTTVGFNVANNCIKIQCIGIGEFMKYKIRNGMSEDEYLNYLVGHDVTIHIEKYKYPKLRKSDSESTPLLSHDAPCWTIPRLLSMKIHKQQTRVVGNCYMTLDPAIISSSESSLDSDSDRDSDRWTDDYDIEDIKMDIDIDDEYRKNRTMDHYYDINVFDEKSDFKRIKLGGKRFVTLGYTPKRSMYREKYGVKRKRSSSISLDYCVCPGYKDTACKCNTVCKC